MTRRLSNLLCIFLILLGWVVPASGHHAIASNYDVHAPINFEGRIESVEWSNPHIYVSIQTTDESGRPVVYAVENGAPNALASHGWGKDLLKPGEIVRVKAFRSKIPQSNRVIGNITLPDGRTFGVGANGVLAFDTIRVAGHDVPFPYVLRTLYRILLPRKFPMKPQTWIFFVATFLAVCLAARTVKDVPRTDGPSPVLRILSRNVLYLAIAAAAVDATAVASDRLFLVIRWLGAGYLIYLGIRCLLFKSANAFSPPSAHASVCAFFLAILPQFLNPVYSRSSQIFILALTSILLEFFFIFPSAGSDRWFYRVAPRVAGVLLCASALGLARII